MKFNQICDLVCEAYKDKYLSIDEDKLDDYRNNLATQGSSAQERLFKVVSNPQVGLKQMTSKHMFMLLSELESYFTIPETREAIEKKISGDIRDIFPETSASKAKRAAVKLFTLLKNSEFVFKFAVKEKERDISKTLEDPESEEWMNQGEHEDIEDLTGGYGPETYGWN